MHSTEPQTLAFALSDSPVGLAAWISEQFRAWTDCDGDLEGILSLDTILTDISIYWFSGNLDASLRLYKENRLDPLVFAPNERPTPPLGIAHFPKELPIPPRSWVERVANVTRWSEMSAGGHFAALEQPDLLANETGSFSGRSAEIVVDLPVGHVLVRIPMGSVLIENQQARRPSREVWR